MRRPTGRPTGRRGALGAGLALAVAAGISSSSPLAAQTYDVVIRNGRVVDGSGNPWRRGDVAIQGDRIAAVGDLSGARGRQEIDATGLWVAPGFVDTHSHAGGGLASRALSEGRPLLAQGVTTVLVNPDGGGWADLAAQRDSLLAHGLGVNVGQLVPHGSVRSEVMGMADRLADEGELEAMRALVRRGMEEGAFGLSSGPFYAPGSYSDTRELVELARVAAEYGGAYQSHIRDESDYTIGVVAAVEEVITVAREAGLPGVVTHMKALGPPVWGFSAALVRRIEAARAEGVEVFADQYPYEASATSLGAALLPRWAQAGGRDSLEARLDDGPTRARIREEAVANLARRGGADRIQFRRFREDPSIEGRKLSEVLRPGEDAVDGALRLLRAGNPSIVSFNMYTEDVVRLMTRPWTMTASDGDLVPMGEGVPHPRNYGAFARKLRVHVVEEGRLEPEDAVRTMTSLPASVYTIPDRGFLRAGAAADVVVFDLAAVRDLGTFTDPHRLAEGMVHVFVNGEAAVRDGRLTGALAGRMLRR